MTAAGRPGHRIWRLDAFRWGIVVGVTVPLVLAGGFHLWLTWASDVSSSPQFNVDVVSTGADLTRYGGRQLVVRHERGRTVQTCRDGCDDLRLEQITTDNVYVVTAVDSDGGILASGTDGYVTGGYGAGISQFDVSGRDQLRVQNRMMTADGATVPLVR